MATPDYTLNQCDGPLIYKYDAATGIYFLNNPIALMFAANKGIPAAGRDVLEVIKASGEMHPVDYDDADESDAEYLDAAIKVLNYMGKL